MDNECERGCAPREVYTWLNEEHDAVSPMRGTRSMVGQGASRHTGVVNACIISYLGRNTPINLSGWVQAVSNPLEAISRVMGVKVWDHIFLGQKSPSGLGSAEGSGS